MEQTMGGSGRSYRHSEYQYTFDCPLFRRLAWTQALGYPHLRGGIALADK